MKTDADYLAELRAVLGPDACIGINNQMGMLAAFVTADYNQTPYVIAGDEESLIRFAREKKEEEGGDPTDEPDDGTALCEDCHIRLPLDELNMTVAGLLCDECNAERRCEDAEFREAENRELSNPY